jgi:hypothetical protein
MANLVIYGVSLIQHLSDHGSIHKGAVGYAIDTSILVAAIEYAPTFIGLLP